MRRMREPQDCGENHMPNSEIAKARGYETEVIAA